MIKVTHIKLYHSPIGTLKVLRKSVITAKDNQRRSRMNTEQHGINREITADQMLRKCHEQKTNKQKEKQKKTKQNKQTPSDTDMSWRAEEFFLAVGTASTSTDDSFMPMKVNFSLQLIP